MANIRNVCFHTNGAAVGERLLRWLLSRALPLFAQVNVEGRGHLGGGGHLVVSNHVGWADPIWMAYAAHPRVLHQMAKQEMFRNRWIAAFLNRLGGFPVDRAKPSPATLKHAVALLRQGELVLVFPTGTRDQTQEEARRGAAVIARMAQAPIVPAFYEGPSTIKLTHVLRRPNIVIRFGPPLAADLSPTATREAAAVLTTRMTEAMQRLRSCPKTANCDGPNVPS